LDHDVREPIQAIARDLEGSQEHNPNQRIGFRKIIWDVVFNGCHAASFWGNAGITAADFDS